MNFFNLFRSTAYFIVCIAYSQAIFATTLAPSKPDLIKGSNTALQLCASCHGAEGNAIGSSIPKLAGQHPEYLIKQLHNFKSKHNTPAERNNPIMAGIAAGLSDADILNVSNYYAKQTLKPAAGKYPDLKILGEKIWRGGLKDKNLPACASCHGVTGKGMPVQFPSLGGQWGEYTEAQLIAFRQGLRKNSLQMTEIAGKMSDIEIKAVSDYSASLR